MTTFHFRSVKKLKRLLCDKIRLKGSKNRYIQPRVLRNDIKTCYGTNFGENKEKRDKRGTSGNSDGHRAPHSALNISINEALSIRADNLVQYGTT